MTDWTIWSSCPVTCGTGTQSRLRSCNFENNNHTATIVDTGCAKGFQNGYYDTQECSMPSCRKFFTSQFHYNLTWIAFTMNICLLFPLNFRSYSAVWSTWADKSPCSKSCATGEKNQARDCYRDKQIIDISNCNGNNTRETKCNLQRCRKFK